MFAFNPLTKWLVIALAALSILLGVAYVSYNKGSEYQKGVYAEAQLKANEQVSQDIREAQTLADKSGKSQEAAKEKIVTKYEIITKEVIKYEKSEVASLFLDPEFVRLHNAAASANEQVQIADPASGVDGASQGSGVTTGAAIGVITRNYERYYQCSRQVTGWIDFYNDLQKQVNK